MLLALGEVLGKRLSKDARRVLEEERAHLEDGVEGLTVFPCWDVLRQDLKALT